MKRYSRRRGRTAGVVVAFGALLLVGLAVKFFGWLVVAAAVVGLFFAASALARNVRQRQAVAAGEAKELAYRADRQHQWARRGDSRGVYGVSGAELMRSISPEPPPMASDVPDEELEVAAVVTTPDGLTTLLAEKALGWRWAAFASVLVQRRAAVQSRLRDCELGYATPTGMRAHSAIEVGRFVTGRMEDLCQLVARVEAFMLTPAFMAVFGSRCDASTADADGIVHVANRLMDYHERFLELAERCRDFQAPSPYAVLLRDVRELMGIPLDAYRTFIDDFVDRIAEMPELLRHARGTVEADPVVLHMHVDDRLLQRISKQLRAAANPH
jgi:hypothetical protein